MKHCLAFLQLIFAAFLGLFVWRYRNKTMVSKRKNTAFSPRTYTFMRNRIRRESIFVLKKILRLFFLAVNAYLNVGSPEGVQLAKWSPSIVGFYNVFLSLFV